jgi:putative ABC transport system permease protein
MTFQFALSIIMIVAIIINFRQLDYLRSADLGFNKKHIITINTPGDIPNEFELRKTFKARLLQHTGIENVTFSYGYPGVELGNSPTIEVNGIRSSLKVLLADADYLDVMGIPLVDGRRFSPNPPSDQTEEDWLASDRKGTVLLNEAAVRQFGIVNPIGQIISSSDSNPYQFEIVGIVRDFHFRSFHDKIEPLIFAATANPGVDTSVKIASSDIPATLKTLETEFKNIWEHTPFNYAFLDDAFNRQYQRDEQLAKVIGYFTVLAVIIACLGLFALSSFMVSRRTKEIGIRKTMGAPVGIIYAMLSWDFMKWILVAIVLACPVAWYLMHLWLETFAYHIALGADVFVIASLLAIVIALLTVTVQSLKVAKANPINSLRYE